jgi:hypothetical protein
MYFTSVNEYFLHKIDFKETRKPESVVASVCACVFVRARTQKSVGLLRAPHPDANEESLPERRAGAPLVYATENQEKLQIYCNTPSPSR